MHLSMIFISNSNLNTFLGEKHTTAVFGQSDGRYRSLKRFFCVQNEF